MMAFSMTFAVVAKFTFMLLTLACKERSFITSCPLTDSIEDYRKWKLNESFICSSLWVNKEVNLLWLKPKPHGVVAVLLLMAGDIETCPGPVQRKVCFGCRKTIRKNQRRSTCDGCKKTLHFKCLGEDLETVSTKTKVLGDQFNDYKRQKRDCQRLQYLLYKSGSDSSSHLAKNVSSHLR